MEPQIPGALSGVPSEGNPSPVQPPGGPGYTVGPMLTREPYFPEGLKAVAMAVPKNRSYRAVCEWRW